MLNFVFPSFEYSVERVTVEDCDIDLNDRSFLPVPEKKEPPILLNIGERLFCTVEKIIENKIYLKPLHKSIDIPMFMNKSSKTKDLQLFNTIEVKNLGFVWSRNIKCYQVVFLNKQT